ncbi:SRPBCC domain-containing protein [Mesorhizobium sp. YC-39]|uniref:SRPBCC domain-containing protein n=1 Tax=unclassified Mesorhizobium TaxID=325217 RepID=UPI0021E9A79C|nr:MULTISPECIES: SRPBCC domain-containing protein [unclassified Mesorhizobium]MCV3208743.1 SRPBCC domain-containing protein [Mesorhizobium sp. YC-2]MCV3231908.1 SRPBCC domain-containing protein [Mesorhizobium sp. YC-39]
MEDQSQYHENFTLERVYPNSRAEVWAAWSIREKKAEWLGNSALEMDFRPGGFERGAFRHATDEHVNETRYFDIAEGQRIVLAYSMAVNGRVHTVSLTTIVFMDEKPGTRLHYTEQMCIIPPSDGLKGREHGWNALLDALGVYLAKKDTKSV